MGRLTEKCIKKDGYKAKDNCPANTPYACANKLGFYEEFEETHNINLIEYATKMLRREDLSKKFNKALEIMLLIFAGIGIGLLVGVLL